MDAADYDQEMEGAEEDDRRVEDCLVLAQQMFSEGIIDEMQRDTLKGT